MNEITPQQAGPQTRQEEPQGRPHRWRLRRAWRVARKVRRDLVHRILGVPWMEVRPDDSFLFSYPRSGNTWLRHIVYYALEGSHLDTFEQMEKRLPTIDMVDFAGHLRALPPGPRFMKSHLPYAPYFLNGKVVYIVRDGRDALISYYDYFRHIHRYRRSFDDFLTKALAGRLRYGSWHDNVGSWIAHSDHPNFLLVRYEEMRADPLGAAKRVFAFCNLPVSEERCAEAVAASSVENVHAAFRTLHIARGTAFSGGVSSGGKKGWRTTMTAEQNARFVDKAGPLLERLGYPLA